MKKCTQCKKIQEMENFTKNINETDGLSAICKKCAKKNNQEYRQRKTDKYGKDEFLYMEWKKKLTKDARNCGLEIEGLDLEKIEKIRFPLIFFPDKSFPGSLSHINFCRKYNLSIEEYLTLKECVRSGKFFIE